MDSAEWPLVAFTIMMQMTAGLLMVSELACLAGGAAAKNALFRRDSVCLLLGVTGMLVSLGHLGNPWHSPFTILNLGESWLSREIFCTAFFVATLAALMVTRHGKKFTAYSSIVAVVACVAGLSTVLVMAKVYMIVTVPSWNSPSTLLNFLGTALLLGAMATGLLAYLRPGSAKGMTERGLSGRAVVPILLCATVGLGMKVIEIPFDLLTGAHTNPRGMSGISALLAAGQILFIFRLALPVVAMALFVWASTPKREAGRLSSVVCTCAFACALAGEVIGRFFFYSMHVLAGL